MPQAGRSWTEMGEKAAPPRPLLSRLARPSRAVWLALFLVGVGFAASSSQAAGLRAEPTEAAAPTDTATVAAAPERVVSLGGGVTEIVYALDQGHRLVAADTSSVYPPATAELPKVGYYRTTPVEGVVSFRPDLVLASSQAGPADVLQRIEGLGVPVKVVSDRPTLESLLQRIQQIATALGVPERGDQLARKVSHAVEEMSGQSSPWPDAQALFLMNRGGRWLAAGEGTAAHATMALAGIHNAFRQFDGYKEIAAESLVALGPDLVVTTTASVEAAGGRDRLRQLPGLSSTPAGQHDRIIVLDDLLALGFGPRLPEAVSTLREGVENVAQR